jgi:hypothetical protein
MHICTPHKESFPHIKSVLNHILVHTCFNPTRLFFNIVQYKCGVVVDMLINRSPLVW